MVTFVSGPPRGHVGWRFRNLAAAEAARKAALVSSLRPIFGPPGAYFGLSWGPFWALLGPILGLLSPLGPLGRSGAAPGSILGCSWAAPGLSWGPLGALQGRSWPLWGRSGPLLGSSGAVLAASWASFGASWAGLGRRKRIVTKPCKNHGFSMVLAWFLGLWGPSWGLLAASGGALGGPWSPLGRLWALRGRPGLAWASVGPS